jgi:hypothetical protein
MIYRILYGLYNNIYDLYNHFILISIVFYVCIYGVVICFKFCSLNSNVCKIMKLFYYFYLVKIYNIIEKLKFISYNISYKLS